MKSPWRPGKADIPLLLLSLVAAVSVSYAIVTAPRLGQDILYYRAISESWVSGVYQPDTGIFYGPPPWTAVALVPLSLLSPSQTILGMLVVNLALAGSILWLAIVIWGRDWGIRERIFLCSLFLAWAPFRIAVRNGQLSLIITALLLAFVLARRQKQSYAAGALLGISLIKYPLSFPFLLYTLWRREWKTAGAALLIPVALTLIYAARLSMSPIRIIQDYALAIAGNLVIKDTAFTGTTEIKPIIDHFLAGQPRVAMATTLIAWAGGLLALGIALRREPKWEDAHFAALSLLSLLAVVHRPYDSVLLIIPAAVLIRLGRVPAFKHFAICGLVLLGLFAISVPGLLVDRLRLEAVAVARNPLGFMGLHLERLIVLSLFCAILMVMIRKHPEVSKPAY